MNAKTEAAAPKGIDWRRYSLAEDEPGSNAATYALLLDNG